MYFRGIIFLMLFTSLIDPTAGKFGIIASVINKVLAVEFNFGGDSKISRNRVVLTHLKVVRNSIANECTSKTMHSNFLP